MSQCFQWVFDQCFRWVLSNFFFFSFSDTFDAIVRLQCRSMGLKSMRRTQYSTLPRLLWGGSPCSCCLTTFKYCLLSFVFYHWPALLWCRYFPNIFLSPGYLKIFAAVFPRVCSTGPLTLSHHSARLSKFKLILVLLSRL